MKQLGGIVRPRALSMSIVDEKPAGQLTLKFRTFDFTMTRHSAWGECEAPVNWGREP